MNKLKKIAILGVLIFIFGCAAMQVPLTANPGDKLKSAAALIFDSDRPLPAERLIKEAIDIYKKSGDKEGIAEGYMAYAYFLHSRAVGIWEKHYQTDGFIMDKSVTFENRHGKAVEYFMKAKDLYEEINRYDAISNIYVTVGNMYYFTFKDNQKACHYYELSLISHQKFKQDNPDEKVILPEGITSYEEYIETLKKKVECS